MLQAYLPDTLARWRTSGLGGGPASARRRGLRRPSREPTPRRPRAPYGTGRSRPGDPAGDDTPKSGSWTTPQHRPHANVGRCGRHNLFDIEFAWLLAGREASVTESTRDLPLERGRPRQSAVPSVTCSSTRRWCAPRVRHGVGTWFGAREGRARKSCRVLTWTRDGLGRERRGFSPDRASTRRSRANARKDRRTTASRTPAASRTARHRPALPATRSGHATSRPCPRPPAARTSSAEHGDVAGALESMSPRPSGAAGVVLLGRDGRAEVLRQAARLERLAPTSRGAGGGVRQDASTRQTEVSEAIEFARFYPRRPRCAATMGPAACAPHRRTPPWNFPSHPAARWADLGRDRRWS